MTSSGSEAWQLQSTEFPADGTRAEQLEFLLGYAILAPSGHNTQPWRFAVSDEAVHVYADRTRALPVVDPQDRELAISCGAAMGNLEVALRRFGMEPSVRLQPMADQPDLFATIAPTAEIEPSTADRALFAAIPDRRTTRTAFPDDPVPPEVLEQCSSSVQGHGVEQRVVTDARDRERVAELVAEGDRIQFADRHFRRELATWIRSHRLGARDGISGAALGMPDILSAAGGLVVRTFDMGQGVAAGDREKILSGSPCLVVLATADDNVEDWLNTGRALSQFLLNLAAAGFTASYLNQPIEVESLRPELQRAAHVAGLPQILLRCGRGDAVEPAARRPVAEVLLNQPRI